MKINVKTIAWLSRLPWWLPVIIRDLPESGEAYVYEMMLPCLAGMLSLAVPLLVLLMFPETRSFWYTVTGVGAVAYLIAGIVTYFWFSPKSYGSWQERGAW